MPKISLIIPVYNTENFLGRCIDSVLAQTYSDFELILVDDGSDDKSGKICDCYSEKDNRIRVIHKHNQGVSHSRNMGIDCALGDYLCFADSDDVVSASYLEALYSGVEHGADISIVGIADCDLSGIQYAESMNRGDFLVSLCKQDEYRIAELLAESRLDYCCGKLFSRMLIQQNNIRFDEAMSKSEDAKFVAEYLICANRIFVVGESHYYYLHRPNGTSLSTKLSDSLYEIAEEVNSLREQVFQLKGIESIPIQTAINQNRIIASQRIIEAYKDAQTLGLFQKIRNINFILNHPSLEGIKKEQRIQQEDLVQNYIFQYHSAFQLLITEGMRSVIFRASCYRKAIRNKFKKLKKKASVSGSK